MQLGVKKAWAPGCLEICSGANFIWLSLGSNYAYFFNRDDPKCWVNRWSAETASGNWTWWPG